MARRLLYAFMYVTMCLDSFGTALRAVQDLSLLLEPRGPENRGVLRFTFDIQCYMLYFMYDIT
jgi:hypothetical protein